jgi:transcriptional regulator with XRE-family HTH domain
MSPIEAIRQMMRAANISASDLSRRIGKSRAYISSTVAHGSTPKVDTLARIAHECGYRIYLERPDHERIELYAEGDESADLSRLLDSMPDNVDVEDLVSAINKRLASQGKLYRVSESEASQMAADTMMKTQKVKPITKDGKDTGIVF